MKNFFKIRKLDRSEKLVFFCLGYCYSFSFFLLFTQKLGLPYFSFKALLLALVVWGLCSIIDKEKYFNIIDCIISLMFGYGVGYFLLEIFLNAKQ